MARSLFISASASKRGELDPLLERQQRILADIGGDGDHEAIHDPGGSADNVDMAIVNGIEGAGVNPNALGRCHRRALPEMMAVELL